MKHLLGPIMILLAVLGACKRITPEKNKDLIWDIAPYSILMEVTDTEGNNLFETSTPGNWLEGPVVATYDGKSYLFPSEDIHTKELLVEVTGLSLIKIGDPPSKTALVFGQFNGGDNLTADITLSWPDGSSDVIAFKHTVSYQDGVPSTKTSHFLNGEAVTAPVSIVKSSVSLR